MKKLTKKESRNLRLTDAQYLSVLKCMRKRIASGIKLKSEDSNTVGDKYTHCSWGLCTDDPEFWEKDELLFPERGPISGSESSKYREFHHKCPYDPRLIEQIDGNGCFFKCLMFHGPNGYKNKINALKLYNKTIKETLKSRHEHFITDIKSDKK